MHSNGDSNSLQLRQNGSSSSPKAHGDVLSKFEQAKNEMIQQFVQLQKTTRALSTAFNGYSIDTIMGSAAECIVLTSVV